MAPSPPEEWEKRKERIGRSIIGPVIIGSRVRIAIIVGSAIAIIVGSIITTIVAVTVIITGIVSRRDRRNLAG